MNATAAKALALETGFDRAGIVGPEVASCAPDWTRSVLVLGLATLDEAFDYEMYIAYDGRRRWHKFVYAVLEAGGARLADRLRAVGLRAAHLLFDDSIRVVDLRLAAVAAGLGVAGLNGLVISPEYGPRIRFTALFTDADWPRDEPLDDYYCLNCTRCWGACPTAAVGPHGFDCSLCIAEFNPTPAMAARQQRVQIHPTPVTRLQCIACLTVCPIGQRRPVERWVDVRTT